VRVGVIEEDWAPSPTPPFKGGDISGYSAVSAAERFINEGGL